MHLLNKEHDAIVKAHEAHMKSHKEHMKAFAAHMKAHKGMKEEVKEAALKEQGGRKLD